MKQTLTKLKTTNSGFFALFVLLVFGMQTSLAQTTVSGAIADAEGPLPGASVVVKGTTTGAVADFDGNYTIEVPEGSNTLVFSYVGYAAQEINVDGQTTINVTLQPDAQSLNEVVVVGYGTQRKADLTGAVGSINAVEIVKQPIVSPDQVLAGTISGVNITNRSGDPGAPISVNIRGVGTLSADANPLYVVDGVPLVGTNNITVNTSSTTDSNPLASINPSDIESIDVLKDAASAAIYGARGANGVIIITTKKGSKGDPKVTYDGYISSASPRETLDVLNVQQYIAIQQELGRDFSAFSGQPNVDWQDAIFQNGFVQNHNVGVSGGGENGTYYVSGSFLDNEGIQRAQSFKRYSLRANSEFRIGKRLKFGESLQISQSDRLTQSEGALNAGFNAALNAPYFQPFGDGPFGYNLANPSTLGGATGNNLLQLTDERINSTTIQNRKVLGHFFGEWEIIDNLKLRPSIGIDYNVGSGDFFQAETTLDGNSTRQSLLVQSRPIELTLTTGATLSYDRTFGDHNFGALIGFEQTKFRFDKVRLQGRNLFNDNFASSGTAVAGANEADLFTLQGIIGRLTYNYKGKYLATINVRRDATSKFAENNRDDIFPSISVGWRLSQEDFMSDYDFIDDLKLRVGYGELGNQNLGDGTARTFPFLSTLNNNIFYVLGDDQGTVVGPAPTTFANRQIGWETSKQIDIGLDFSLMKGKITGVFDYFKKTNEDALVNLPLPFASGFFLPAPTNAGEITNSGIELALNYKNKIGEDFEYGVGFNITTVKNTVQSLGPVSQIIAGVGGAQSHRTIVGESLGHFFGYKTDGLYQNDAEVAAALPDANGTPSPGDIRFVDVNGDGQVNADDRTILGSPYPGFFYGLNLQAKYKGFDFSALLRGVGDRQIYNSSRITLEGLTGTNNFSTQVLNRWTGEGSTNSSSNPRLAGPGDPNGNNRISDRFIEDADYLRIQNIQLGYTVPKDALQSWTNNFVSNMRFFVSVQNLATFTGYSGFDPEVGRAQSFQKGNNPLATGQDDGQAPLPRIIQLGWSVSFN
ncbi:SusC/RagA family TonB-linked outer membrane protein [Flagellimonas flava]|uniref:TonB-linked outer membrane protein, SusC/RagA family n=1 Tax=Flagellimonas flava TaxID=570519 RepID=A0A1M5JY56_9FLAO|nr:TonB-dependent receptor [Allomuricauda flava]SHG45315.1 TonB-linked outer membrane protein, SusC/RagA family [Allomuricauda flava]